MLGISKRGDVYVRYLLIHGARAVVRCVDKKLDRKSNWVKSLKERKGYNIAAVALANKTVRTIWAILKNDSNYQLNYQPTVA